MPAVSPAGNAALTLFRKCAERSLSGAFNVHCRSNLTLPKVDGEHRLQVAAPHLTGTFAVIVVAGNAEEVAIHFPWDDPDTDKHRSPTHLSASTDLAEPDADCKSQSWARDQCRSTNTQRHTLKDMTSQQAH